MKKSIISCMMIIIMFLIMGCASEEPITDEISIYDALSFNFDSLTYTDTSAYDVLYQTGYPSFDFMLFYEKNNPGSMSESDQLIYQALLETLYELSIVSTQSMKEMILLSSSDLRALYETYDRTIGLSDIVAFNNLKTIISNIETSNDYDRYIRKIDYMNERLMTVLSDEEISNLQTLQDYHLRFMYDGMPVFFKDETFDAWKEKLTLLGEEPHENDLVLLEDAFDLIKNLIRSS